MRLSATQFLHKNNFEGKFFILFGEEEILKVKTSKKILKNQEIHSEKIKLDLEDDDFEKIIQNFLFSNSLFSSKKILIINLKRSRVTKAIKEAITKADPNEIILVAGKGHEIHQDYGNKVLSISDRQIINRLKVKKKTR